MGRNIVSGMIYNDTRFADGSIVYTSVIKSIEGDRLQTTYTLYELGAPAPEHKAEDSND